MEALPGQLQVLQVLQEGLPVPPTRPQPFHRKIKQEARNSEGAWPELDCEWRS